MVIGTRRAAAIEMISGMEAYALGVYEQLLGTPPARQVSDRVYKNWRSRVLT